MFAVTVRRPPGRYAAHCIPGKGRRTPQRTPQGKVQAVRPGCQRRPAPGEPGGHPSACPQDQNGADDQEEPGPGQVAGLVAGDPIPKFPRCTQLPYQKPIHPGEEGDVFLGLPRPRRRKDQRPEAGNGRPSAQDPASVEEQDRPHQGQIPAPRKAPMHLQFVCAGRDALIYRYIRRVFRRAGYIVFRRRNAVLRGRIRPARQRRARAAFLLYVAFFRRCALLLRRVCFFVFVFLRRSFIDPQVCGEEQGGVGDAPLRRPPARLPSGPVDQHHRPHHFQALRFGRIQGFDQGAPGGGGVLHDGRPVAGSDRPRQPPPGSMVFGLLADGEGPERAAQCGGVDGGGHRDRVGAQGHPAHRVHFVGFDGLPHRRPHQAGAFSAEGGLAGVEIPAADPARPQHEGAVGAHRMPAQMAGGGRRGFRRGHPARLPKPFGPPPGR